jgi:putative IMPACT (imprinted ancient) family translation regulator
LSEIDDGGNTGNVLSGVSVVVDEKGRKKLTFTKTSVATSGAFDTLSEKVAEIETNYKAADAGLLGKDTDAAGAATIHGALKAAAAAQSKADTNAQAITDLDNDLQGQINTLNGTVGGHTESIANLVAEDVKINKAITDMDAAYKAADTALEKRIVAGTDGNSTFATGDYKNINALSAAIKAAEGRLTTAEGTITNHGERVVTLESDVSDLKGLVGEGENVQTRINNAVAALRKEILTDGTANDNINDAYDTIQEIATWLGENQLGKDAGQIIEELNSLSGTVGGHTNDIADLKAADTTIRGEFAAADTALKKELVGADAASGDYKTINALSAAVEANEDDIADHEGRLTTAEGTISTHTGDIADLKAADTTIRGEFAAADTALKTGILGQENTTGIEYATIKALSEHVKTAEGNISTNAGDIETLKGTTGTHTEQIGTLTSHLTWGEF